MKRIVIALLFCISGCAVNEKPISVLVDCKDTIPDFQDSVSLNAEVSPEPGDKLKRVKWLTVSGPSIPTITDSNKTVAMARGLRPGMYIFSFTVISENGAKQTALDSVIVAKTGSDPKSAP